MVEKFYNISELKEDNNQQSDIFMKAVVEVLSLSDYRYDHKIDLSSQVSINQIADLKKLCSDNTEYRRKLNRIALPELNFKIGWSRDILCNYFNLDV